MRQLDLCAAPLPPVVAGVDLRLGDVATVCADESLTADLCHADPPWTYGYSGGGNGAADEHYDTITNEDIAAHVDAAWDRAAPSCYLLLWCTWPKLTEWLEASRGMRWVFKTGGCWGKVGRPGVGFHWRGDSEPLLVYVKGNPRPLNKCLSNLYLSERTEHSEKPTEWLRSLVSTFCPEGGTVLDLYAGLAPLARACVSERRLYVGAEIDPDRHARALGLLAHHRGLR